MDYGENVRVGCRVELSPGYDLWMRGAKYGYVKSISEKIASVKMDHPEIKTLQKIPVDDLMARS